jgi:hypothetical protein
MNNVQISVKELETLLEWLNTFEQKPRLVTIITESTAIGTAVRGEFNVNETEGCWKDLTDYDNW